MPIPLGQSLKRAIDKVRGKPTLDERAVHEFIREVQRALIEGDVNVKLVLQLTKRVKERALKETPPPGVSRKDLAVKILIDELIQLLGGKRAELPVQGRKTNVIMVVGIEGSGKTTTVAKLAHWFSKRYGKVAVISSDVIRPAAHEQLKQLLGDEVPIFRIESRDPVEIIREGVSKFRKEKYNVVLVDTAGRHKDEEGLMKELEDYVRAADPDLVLLVIDGTIGQAAFSQAKSFAEKVKVGGVVVTKLDGAAKGGGALSAVVAAGAPIYFIGTGESLEDLERFDPERFVSRLLGGGDLIELAKRVEEAFSDLRLVEKISKGKFDLNDFREYLEELSKAGPLDRLLEMIPGLSFKSFDLPKENLSKWIAIINSMTPEERRNPSIIKGSRIERIARGSGTRSKDVRVLLKSYQKTRKLMESSSTKKMQKMLRRMGLSV